MTKINFMPWVGSNYTEGWDNKRIMVLDESHYCANPSESISSTTQQVINDLLDEKSEYEPYKATYLKFEKALIGYEPSFYEREELWQRIMFYNYVQSPLTDTRKVPSSEQFNESEKAFWSVVDTYKPDVLLVWGTRLYNNLPQKGKQGEDLVMPNGSVYETWTYETSPHHTIQILPIQHPSTGFSWNYWYDVIYSFIHR